MRVSFMKKKIMYLALLTILFFSSMNGVMAEEDVLCVYELNSSLKAKINVTVEKDTVNVKLSGSGYVIKDKANDLAAINFQSGEKWKCPSNLYWKMGASSQADRHMKIEKISAVKKDGYQTVNLLSEESSDGGTISGSTGSDEKMLHCKYGGLTISYNSSTFNYSKPCDTTSVTFDQDDLSKTTCPDYVYKVSSNGRGGDVCVYSLESSGGSSVKIELNEDDPIPDADGDDQSGNPPPSTNSGEKSSGCGILGGTNSETVKLLSWAMKIIRLGVPILIIILGMIDFLQILFSGEDKVFKDAFSKFVKRLIIGVCIIFIPYIIQLVIRLSGVDTQYGIDNFYCGIIDATSGVKIEAESYDDPKSCVQGGYYWIPKTGECVSSISDKLRPEPHCTSNGYKWKSAVMAYGGECYRPEPSSYTSYNDCEKIGYTWHHVASREYGGYCSKK